MVASLLPPSLLCSFAPSLLFFFQLLGPVCDYGDWIRAGPFEGHVEEEALSVGGYVVEVPRGFGDAAGLEQHLRIAGLYAISGGANLGDVETPVLGDEEEFGAI